MHLYHKCSKIFVIYIVLAVLICNVITQFDTVIFDGKIPLEEYNCS